MLTKNGLDDIIKEVWHTLLYSNFLPNKAQIAMTSLYVRDVMPWGGTAARAKGENL